MTNRNIRVFLDQVGISEVTYHALRRQEAISFMPRRQKGQGGFTDEQLLALKAFALLRSHGLNTQTAAEAVEASFPAMRRLAAEGELSTDAAYKVGVRLLALNGKLTLASLSSSPRDEVVEVGRLELDLRGISALLAPQRNLYTSS